MLWPPALEVERGLRAKERRWPQLLEKVKGVGSPLEPPREPALPTP